MGIFDFMGQRDAGFAFSLWMNWAGRLKYRIRALPLRHAKPLPPSVMSNAAGWMVLTLGKEAFASFPWAPANYPEHANTKE